MNATTVQAPRQRKPDHDPDEGWWRKGNGAQDPLVFIENVVGAVEIMLQSVSDEGYDLDIAVEQAIETLLQLHKNHAYGSVRADRAAIRAAALAGETYERSRADVIPVEERTRWCDAVVKACEVDTLRRHGDYPLGVLNRQAVWFFLLSLHEIDHAGETHPDTVPAVVMRAAIDAGRWVKRTKGGFEPAQAVERLIDSAVDAGIPSAVAMNIVAEGMNTGTTVQR